MKLNQIFNLDCIEFLDLLEANKTQVDIIITSPPYNIGINYGKNFDDDKPNEEYFDWLKQVAEKSCILKDNGSFFLNLGHISKNPSMPFEIVKRFENAKYKLQNSIIWLKSISIDKESIGKNNNNSFKDISIGHLTPINSDCYLSNLYEYIFHFTKTAKVKLNKLDIGVPYQDKTNITRGKSIKPDLRDRGNVWFIPYKTIQEKRLHPAVFPIQLPKMCIKLHGYNKNTIVSDPFMGNGTIALACIDLGVNYLGTEINSLIY